MGRTEAGMLGSDLRWAWERGVQGTAGFGVHHRKGVAASVIP